MTKTIDTLTHDIQELFNKAQLGETTNLPEAVLAKFGSNVAMHVADSVAARNWTRPPKTLRMSEIGKPCLRQLWYGVYQPGMAEKMLGHTLFKFTYGDMIEEATLLLAEAAGHTVTNRQERVELEWDGWRIVGHIDAMIDGVLVDVKSASSYSYKKFFEGLDDTNDAFGYRYQLSSYFLGLVQSGLIAVDGNMGFLAVDKQNGHIGYFPTRFTSMAKRLGQVIPVVQNDKHPPARGFKLVPEGTSGNMKLCMECSYCPFKKNCWKDANGGYGLRTFLYSTGPVFLGTVMKTPKVPEITEVNPTSIGEELLSATDITS